MLVLDLSSNGKRSDSILRVRFQSRPLVIVSNMEHDISNMILENVQNHKYPFLYYQPPCTKKKGRTTMADLVWF
jgi:hypothetical protein